MATETGQLTPVDFTMRSGDTMPIEVTVRNEDGAVVNLTGASAKWGLYSDAKMGDEQFTKDGTQGGADNGISFPTPASGRLDVQIDPADTASLEGRFYHELQITDATSNVKTVMVGTVTIVKDRVE